MNGSLSRDASYRGRWLLVLALVALWVGVVLWALAEAPHWLRVVTNAVFMVGLAAQLEHFWPARGGARPDRLVAAPLVVRVLARHSFVVVFVSVIIASGHEWLSREAALVSALLVLLVAAVYVAQLVFAGWAGERFGGRASAVPQPADRSERRG